MDNIDIIQGDFGYNLNFTVKTAASVVRDITNYTITLIVWAPGTPATNLLTNGACVIDDGASGTCHYVIKDGDFDDIGYFYAKLELTVGSSIAESPETFSITVAGMAALSSVALVTLPDAKEYLRVDDDSHDEIILRLIEAATKIAENYSDRAFIQRSITESHEGDGDNILRLFKRPISSITSVVRDVSETGSDGDGSTVAWTLSESPTSGSVKVYADGILQTLTTDYTISGSVVTFVTAPAADVKIAFTYTHTIIKISEYTEQLNKGKIIGATAWASSTIYTVVYTAGEASTREATQALIPNAVTAVLLILSDLYENRGDTVDSVSISGIGSASYKLPSRAERILFNMKPLGGFV